jgi:hypothetical protein
MHTFPIRLNDVLLNKEGGKSQEYVDLYIHFPIRLNGVVLT